MTSTVTPLALLFVLAGAGCSSDEMNARHGKMLAVNLGAEAEERLATTRPVPADHVIVEGDLLSIEFQDTASPGISTIKMVRVRDDGTIPLPYVDPIKAEGLTGAGLERKLTEAYQNARVIKNLQTVVMVVDGRDPTPPSSRPSAGD